MNCKTAIGALAVVAGVGFSAPVQASTISFTSSGTVGGYLVSGTADFVYTTGSGVFNDVNLKARWITDAEIRVHIGPQYELSIGANNVFDYYPTKVPTGLAGVSATGSGNVYYPSTSYVAPWSSFSPFGFNGRYLYVRGTARF